MTHRRTATSLLRSTALLLLLATAAQAQNVPFQIPPGVIPVDLTAHNNDRKVVLLDDGEAIEAPLVFTMIDRQRVTVEARLPSTGRFDVQLDNPRSPFEVKDIVVKGNVGRAQIALKRSRVSPSAIEQQAAAAIDKLLPPKPKAKAEQEANERKLDELRAYLTRQKLGVPDGDEQLRQKYVRVRALQSEADLLRDKMDEAAERHPRWYTPEQKQIWRTASAGTLFGYYQQLLEMELCDEALRSAGLDYDRSTRNAAKNIKPMLWAVYEVASGRAIRDKNIGKQAADILGAGGMAQLREAITVSLKCRLYSGSAETADANSQWFNAQRVSCRASGVSTIRIQGRLDPSAGDEVDWWILERFDLAETVLETTQAPGVRFDAPIEHAQGARLRIAATGKDSVDYWFEFRNGDRPGALKVIVHESPAAAGAKFPY